MCGTGGCAGSLAGVPLLPNLTSYRETAQLFCVKSEKVDQEGSCKLLPAFSLLHPFLCLFLEVCGFLIPHVCCFGCFTHVKHFSRTTVAHATLCGSNQGVVKAHCLPYTE